MFESVHELYIENISEKDLENFDVYTFLYIFGFILFYYIILQIKYAVCDIFSSSNSSNKSGINGVIRDTFIILLVVSIILILNFYFMIPAYFH